MSDFQEFCKNILPFVQAGADGDVIQWNSGQCGWLDCNDAHKDLFRFGAKTEFRIKPRTIKIGDFDVPEPMRNEPSVGSTVYLASTIYVLVTSAHVWLGGDADRILLERGIVHGNASDAQIHSEALIALTSAK